MERFYDDNRDPPPPREREGVVVGLRRRVYVWAMVSTIFPFFVLVGFAHAPSLFLKGLLCLFCCAVSPAGAFFLRRVLNRVGWPRRERLRAPCAGVREGVLTGRKRLRWLCVRFSSVLRAFNERRVGQDLFFSPCSIVVVVVVVFRNVCVLTVSGFVVVWLATVQRECTARVLRQRGTPPLASKACALYGHDLDVFLSCATSKRRHVSGRDGVLRTAARGRATPAA